MCYSDVWSRVTVIRCPDDLRFSNAANTTWENEAGAVVTFVCAEGHNAGGGALNFTATCTDDGEWNVTTQYPEGCRREYPEGCRREYPEGCTQSRREYPEQT